MRPDDLLRAVRHVRRLSQRELAEQAKVPRSTVDRIESGRSRDPGVEMIDRILRGAGFHLAVLNDHGRELQVRGDRFRIFDRAQRHFPAHLEARRIEWLSPWWGWTRIAWWPGDPAVPEYTYDRRPNELRKQDMFRDDRWDDRWDDAT